MSKDIKKAKVLIVGQDNRFLILRQLFLNKKYQVFLYSDIIDKNIKNTNDLYFDIVVLPVLYSKEDIINNILKYTNKNTLICGGKLPLDIHYNCEIFDYYLYEPLTIKNAAITSEGAIAEAINNSDFSLINSKVLITGFGRISKTLLNMLQSFTKDITVAARKPSDRAYIESFGFKAIDFTNIKNNAKKYNYVFNTVPYLIFNEDLLSKFNKECLFIDLASKPGGIDFNFANNQGIKAVHSLALPGKYAPKTAAQLIFISISEKIKGEKQWKI